MLLLAGVPMTSQAPASRHEPGQTRAQLMFSADNCHAAGLAHACGTTAGCCVHQALPLKLQQMTSHFESSTARPIRPITLFSILHCIPEVDTSRQ